MTSPYYDPKLFLLEHDLDKELIQQTLELMNFICGDSDMSVPQDKAIRQMFVDTIDKYRDSESISIESIKEKIAEQGYEYLTNVFEVTDERLRILAAYLPMIRILKGTRPGLELIFTILNVGFEIKEWWEDPVNLEILSYILFVELINQPITTTVVPRLKEFSRQYLYPLLTQVVYAILYKFNKTPYIGAAVYSKTAITVWQEFLWLIWSGDSSPENLWTDQYPYQDPEEHKSLWQGNVEDELEWDPNDGSDRETNKWSESKGDIRTWKLDKPETMKDVDLLEWWVYKINLFGGKPEESWCTEDKDVEDPIITYWSGENDPDMDGSLVKLTVIANPSRAIVEINGEISVIATVKKGVPVKYRVYDPQGKYMPKSGEVTLLKDTVISVSLTQAISNCKLTVVSNVPEAMVYISEDATFEENEGSTGSKEHTAKGGKMLYWQVRSYGYYAQSGSVLLVDSDVKVNVTLKKLPIYNIVVEPTPSNAKVVINGKERKSVSVYLNEAVTWSVSASGYYSKSGSVVATKHEKISVVLEELKTYTLTIQPTPSNAAITINGVATRSISVKDGTSVAWIASASGYMSLSGSKKVTKTETMKITLQAPKAMQCYYTPYSGSNFGRLYLYKEAGAKAGATIYAKGTGNNPGYLPSSTSKVQSSQELEPAYKLSGNTRKYLTLVSCPIETAATMVFTGEDVNVYGITPIRHAAGDVQATPPDATVTLKTNVTASIVFKATSGSIISTTANSVKAKYGSVISFTATPSDSNYRTLTDSFTVSTNETLNITLEKKQATTVTDANILFSWTTSVGDNWTSATLSSGSIVDNSGTKWSVGDYIAVGPATVTVSMTPNGNPSSSDFYWLSTAAFAYTNTNTSAVGTNKVERLNSGYAHSATSSVSAKPVKLSFSLASGQYLTAIGGTVAWSGKPSSSIISVGSSFSRDVKATVSCTVTKTVYQ